MFLSRWSRSQGWPKGAPSLRAALVLSVVVPVVVSIGVLGFLALRAIQLVARAIRSPLSRALEREGSATQALASARPWSASRLAPTTS